MCEDFVSAKTVLFSENAHITEKMRALFTLRNILTDESALTICEAFKFKSVLLKHELAYVLGQMRLEVSLPKLISVLKDESENEIVRHEAAEALGNFDYKDKTEILKLLHSFINHESKPLSETAYLSYNKLKREVNEISKYNSFDPAMPLDKNLTREEMRKFLLDDSSDLFLKYEIIFYLRDLATIESISLLGEGMKNTSELLKHEIAFVVGQIANLAPENVDVAVDWLINELRNKDNHPMVRHECAESLGAICNERCNEILKEYINDECDIVRESCLVALDISDYKISEEAEYSIKA
ncbi:hypothetical protein H312_02474 [Anncaliia algerae PRA339]|uniref:Deoxyhypusine hydroxylase n=1 Tax=Anncaliia algerae PRA339 TaxID=1288291 RepID=A0A059EZ64_9MICR|nr:hypothetical protein H312_02474 [Anncaliia algerae PRA339]